MLRKLPLSLFTVVMGLTGTAIALHAMEKIGGLPGCGSFYFSLFALSFYAIVTVAFIGKMIFNWDAVAADWRDPMHIAVFPAISISMLLLAVSASHYSLALSKTLWVCGAGLNILFSLAVFQSWIKKTHYKITHMSPVWFVPVVGNIIVPIVGIQYGPLELSWFYFSIGFVFWLVLLTIVFYRLLFHNPLPRQMAPTLFILIAPPAVGFVSYMKLAGGLDPFARILYYIAVFFLLVNLTQLRDLIKVPFTLSWWAISFPLASLTSATLVMYHHTQLPFFLGMGYVLFSVLICLVGYLLIRTVQALRH